MANHHSRSENSLESRSLEAIPHAIQAKLVSLQDDESKNIEEETSDVISGPKNCLEADPLTERVDIIQSSSQDLTLQDCLDQDVEINHLIKEGMIMI